LKDGVAVYTNVHRAPALTGFQSPRLVRIKDTPEGVSPLLATYYQLSTVERGDQAAAQIAKGLAATPVLGRDPNGDLLRAAFKKAMAQEGIPSHVEEMARRFYGGRGSSGPKPQPAAAPKVDAFGWEEPSDASNTGGLLGALRKLFGGGS